AYSDGANPYFGRLLQPSDGFLYGTTPGGGTYGTGVVYRLDTSGNFAILHAFNNTDGAYPYGPLIQATDGLFYGTTSGGVANGAGTVYRLDGGGALETLHAFNSADGANPLAALLETTDGKLYGTTVGGGIGYGTVFRITLGPVTQLSVSAAGVYGGPISLSATLAFGAPLDGTQLNATTNAFGTFVYNPPAGTILPVGAGQTLSVTFVSLDANYTNASATATIDVVNQVDLDFGTFSIGAVEIP